MSFKNGSDYDLDVRKLTHSEEVKKKRADSLRGKKRTEETRAKMSAAHRGKDVSDETRAKMSERKLGNKNAKGWVATQEQKDKMSAPHKKQVMTPFGVFDSIKDAAEFYKVGHSTMTHRVKSDTFSDIFFV